MTAEEKQDIIDLIKSFQPLDLDDDDNKRVAQVVNEITT